MLRQMKLSEWIQQFEQHVVNVREGTIAFDSRVTLPIHMIGTVSYSSGAWVWAWANEESSFSDSIVVESLKVKAYGEQHGISELTTPRYSLNDFNGHVLGLFAAGICDNRVYIPAPNNDLEVYFFVENTGIDFSTPTPPETVISVISQVIAGFDVDHRIFVESFLADEGFEIANDGNDIQCNRDGRSFRVTMDDRGKLTNIT